MEGRSRTVTVPRWVKAVLYLRGVLQPLTERGAYDRAAEADQLFMDDVRERGAEAASAPIGAGGEAVQRVDREAAGTP
jgi:hypothetical protein